MGEYLCFTCGQTTDQPDQTSAGLFCPQCGDRLDRTTSDQAAEMAPQELQAPAEKFTFPTEPKRYRPEFTGSAGEYFRIWIVNTFLTIVTLGIYGAWAKVRNRQYFYKNTVLDGHSFDYTADPVAILKGYLLIGAGFLLYNLAGRYRPEYGFIILGVFFVVSPFLVYKSLRFFAHNSVYRNIRFRFLGSLGEGYRTYVLYPLLIPFTLGFIVPYWAFRKKKYFFRNMAYGAGTNNFEGRPGPFYKVYLLAALIAVVVSVGGFLVMSAAVATLVRSAGAEPNVQMFMAIGFAMYLVMLILATFFQQYLYAWSTNYCWANSKVGDIRFISTLSALRLFWIRISNIIAILLSLGLLAPWARVRRTRYVLQNLSVVTGQSLNEVAAAASTEDSAYGDAATDFFDLEIGL